MPLSPAVPRELIHTRQIECRGFRRTDGMWDIEGHLTDTKTYAFDNEWRGEVLPGVPVHQMWLRLTLDDELIIREIEAVTDHSPFPICPAIAPNFQRLRGLSITKGFIGRVRDLLGGVEGCTHLVEMMGPVATTAFQTIHPYRNRELRKQGHATDTSRRPRLLNSCHAFAETGDVVKRLWPEFYTPK
jgi:hypothetical protein